MSTITPMPPATPPPGAKRPSRPSSSTRLSSSRSSSTSTLSISQQRDSQPISNHVQNIEDSDESEREEEIETEPEHPTVYPTGTELNFDLHYQSDDDEEPLIASGHTKHVQNFPRIQLKNHDLLQHEQIFPSTTVTLSHSHDTVLNYIEKHHVTSNHMSYTGPLSTSTPANKNLLYTDSHAPYVHVARTRPLSLWFIHPPHLQLDPLCQYLSSQHHLIYITIDRLMQHAQTAKFVEYQLYVQTLNEGFTLSSKQIYLLLLFFLNTNDEILENGYILTSSLQIDILDLQNLSAFIDIKHSERNVWPPQFIFDYTQSLSTADLLFQYQSKKKSMKLSYNSSDFEVNEKQEKLEGEKNEEDEQNKDGNDRDGEDGSSRPSTPSDPLSPSISLLNGIDDLKTYEQIEEDLNNYKQDYKYLHSFLRLFPQARINHIEIDGTSSLSSQCSLISHSLSQLLNYAQPSPYIIEQELKPVEEDDIRELLPLKEFETEGLSEPIRAQQYSLYDKFGIYQTFCPVTLYLEDRLAEGSEEFTVTYCGNVYMMANQQAYNLFIASPHRFLSTPPCLPTNYNVLLLGAPKIGKSSIASYLANNYQWNVLTYDINNAPKVAEKDKESQQHMLDELLISKYGEAKKTKSSDQIIMDNGPTTVAQFELFEKFGIKFDKIIYLYVENVEVLPDRLKSYKVAQQLLNQSKGLNPDGTPIVPPSTNGEEENNNNLNANNATGSGTGTSRGKVSQPNSSRDGDSSSASSSLSPPSTTTTISKKKKKKEVTHDDEVGAEEEELMDKADEFQNDIWPSLLPYFEEHAYNFSEINAGPTIDNVIESVRCAIDPFYAYRKINSAQKCNQDMIERKDEERRNRKPEVRELRYDSTNFCPVCLLDDHLLVPGINNEAYMIEAQTYSLCSSNCGAKFLADPNKYNLYSSSKLLSSSLSPSLPDNRYLIVGSYSTGKSQTAQLLSQKFPQLKSFKLSTHFYPAFKSLLEDVLKQVLKLEELENQRKAHEKEQRKLLRKQQKELEKLNNEDNENEESEAEESASEEDDNVDSDPPDELLQKDKETLRLYLQCDENNNIYEHSTLLSDVLEEEWLNQSQLDELLLSIFKQYHLSPSSSLPSGWICEVDLYHPILVTTVEQLILANHVAKPHVIIPCISSTKLSVWRMVTLQLQRESSSSYDKMKLTQVNEKHRLKMESIAKAKAEKELQAKLAAEAEAAKAAKASKGKRFGKKDSKDITNNKEDKEELKKDKATKKAKEKKQVEIEEEAVNNDKEESSDAPSSVPDSSSTKQELDREKSEVEIAMEEEAEQKKLEAKQHYEELTALMTELYKAAYDVSENLLQNLKLSSFVTLPPLSSTTNTRLYTQSLYNSLIPFQAAQYALFRNPIVISNNDANRLLKCGTKSYTSFGSYCPVCAYHNKLRYDCKKDNNQDYLSILWSHFIIFTCADKNHAGLLMDNIKLYLTSSPLPPPIAFSSIIIGPPLSGKTSLANTLGKKFNLAIINMESLLAELANQAQPTLLSREISELLCQGGLISDETKVRALCFAIHNTPARLNGWILDGFPENINQAKIMRSYGIQAMEIINLSYESGVVGSNDMFARFQSIQNNIMKSRLAFLTAGLEQLAINETGEELVHTVTVQAPPLIDPDDPDAPPIPQGNITLNVPTIAQIPPFPTNYANTLDVDFNTNTRSVGLEFNEHETNIGPLLDYYNKCKYNITSLNVTTNSNWQLSDQLYQLFSYSLSIQQLYRFNISALPTLPARVDRMNIHPQFLRKHISSFGSYCPICWNNEHKLSKYKEDLKYTVEYQQIYYRFCNQEHMNLFLSSPTQYLLPSPPLPSSSHLPFRVCANDEAKISKENYELLGCCPVTLYNSYEKGDLSVVDGLDIYSISYNNKLYRCATSYALSQFLSYPSKYSSLSLPQKLPVTLPVMSNQELLRLGKTLAYMQKNVSEIIQKGMISMHSNRCKYPGLSLNSSALLYLTLYLKQHNPRNAPHITEK